MTRREAKRLVCSVLSATLQADLDNGSEWIYSGADQEQRSTADAAKIERAIHEVIEEMDRRSGKQ